MTETATQPTLAELRTALLEQADKLADINGRSADERASFADDERRAIESIQNLDAQYKARACASLTDPTPTPAAPLAGTRSVGGIIDNRSVGQRVVGSDDYRSWNKDGRSGPLVMEVLPREFIGREARANNLFEEGSTDTVGAGQFLPLGTPFLSPAGIDRRRLFIEDLCASGSTTLSSVPYIRELNPRTTELTASTVSEGGSKPEGQNAFSRADAPVRKVAVWVPATEEILADAPTVRSYIDDRLRYMVMLARELQILKGNGLAPDLTGILNTAGIQTQGATSGDPIVTIANALAKIENVDLQPDGVTMNPIDFWTMAARRTSGSGQLDIINFQDPVSPRIWGLPVVSTRSQTGGHVTVGAWKLAAMVLNREDVTLRVGDQHSDYFIKNLLVILCETRLALAIHRPDGFVDATI